MGQIASSKLLRVTSTINANTLPKEIQVKYRNIK